jgi:hypothetical protein
MLTAAIRLNALIDGAYDTVVATHRKVDPLASELSIATPDAVAHQSVFTIAIGSTYPSGPWRQTPAAARSSASDTAGVVTGAGQAASLSGAGDQAERRAQHDDAWVKKGEKWGLGARGLYR